MRASTTTEPARPQPGLARRLLLSCAALLLGLVLAEIVVRASGLEPARYAETRHLESADKRQGLDLYPSDPHGEFPLDLRDETTRDAWSARVEDLAAWAERAPHAVPGFYSAELCRVQEEAEGLPPADPQRPRVVLVGDSFVEGQGVVFGETVGPRLAAALGDDHDVLACGRRGYDFAMDAADDHGLTRWMERHVLDADVVVYAMTLNDPARSEAFAARQSYVDDWIVDRRRMLAHDQDESVSFQPRLLALIDDRLEAARIGRATMAWYTQMVERENADGWSATLEQLAAFAASLARDGRELVVALWPLLVGLEREGAYPFAATHARIVADLTERGLEVVDTLPSFVGTAPDTLWVHAVDHHPNAEGHRRFTDAIAPAVRRALAQSRRRRDSVSP